jgi:hypothetical protein
MRTTCTYDSSHDAPPDRRDSIEPAARAGAPRQGFEGAPDAWLEIESWAAEAVDGLAAGDEIIVI